MQHVDTNKNLIGRILIIFLITRGIMIAVYYIYCAVYGDASGFEKVFGRWDTEYYTDIIENGYHLPPPGVDKANWAFFPLFPLACRGVMIISGGLLPAFWCGIIVSNVCLILLCFFAVKLIRNKGLVTGESGPVFTGLAKDGLLIVWLLMLGPFTVYFSACYTESMFMLWVVLFFYFADKKNFLLAGMFATLAGTTRSVGCALVVPLVMAMYSEYADRKGNKNILKFIGDIFTKPTRIISILIVPAGLLLFMLHLHYIIGDAFGFIHIQSAWRDDNFFPVLEVLGRHLFGGGTPRYTVSAWICIAAFVMYVWMFVKGLKKEAVWGLVSLLIPLTSHVMSTPRFITGSFVIWIGMYVFIKKMRPAPGVIFTGVLYAGGMITIAMWYAQARFLM